ncbi:conserved hypothetical protein (plasmid) [Bacillus cereus 03BB108]|uniref:Uncharacterized protein n=3 Tax=Bacillus cereus group TaxID=86661 RepID=A0A0J1KNQ0_BACAN|nr:hypothetical protein AK40_5743 [Bacillus cereus 03BB108]EDX59842.1 conserved hypothetical protein [Bacillus cereus 03BB108]KLV18305.1 hypothetical protein ABW01_13060 [Bacillus anthracis]ONG63799.1 hypothetical protein BKK44_26950 [Bacillus cereus]OUB77013.1 hypothetical protein BK750_03840 [Bacillus thuringiensis serovar jegathesan]
MTVFSDCDFILSDHAHEQFFLRSNEKDIEEHLLNAYVSLETESHIYYITDSFRFPCKKEDNSYIVKSALTSKEYMKPYE